MNELRALRCTAVLSQEEFANVIDARALFLDVLADELREEARIRSPLAL